MKPRILLERLIVTGENCKNAEIDFRPGANYVVGPSDTGKSYIFSCLDYLLGGGDCPERDMPEAEPYSDAHLQFTVNGSRFTIKRDLKKVSPGYLSEGPFEKFRNPKKLGQKNNTFDGDNISEFLLSKIGVSRAQLKTNTNNHTEIFSFRDFANFVLIDEVRVITKSSPFYDSADGYMKFTKKKSALKFILTGKDDSGLDEQIDPVVVKSRIRGKIELLESLVAGNNFKILQLKQASPSNQAFSSEEQIRIAIESLENSSTELKKHTEQRSEILAELERIKREISILNERKRRFEILKLHYETSIERFDFIEEGANYINQLRVTNCPICGTLMSAAHHDHILNSTSATQQIMAISAEQNIIRAKSLELADVILGIDNDISSRQNDLHSISTEYQRIDNLIHTVLLPEHTELDRAYRNLLQEKQNAIELASAEADMVKFSSQITELSNQLDSSKPGSSTSFEFDTKRIEALCDEMKAVLEKLEYPNLSVVTFDSTHKIFDFRISDRGRGGHGKGIRAISYASFAVALQNYCFKYETNHPGFIVIDSPLTTYHKRANREADDEISGDMQIKFFELLSNYPKDRQIIVFDNKYPVAQNVDGIYIHEFSSIDKSVRRGFFP